jgi:hypothetical protein
MVLVPESFEWERAEQYQVTSRLSRSSPVGQFRGVDVGHGQGAVNPFGL